MTAPKLPPNWPAIRTWLVGSLVPGSTAVVDVVDQAARVQEARAQAGRTVAQHRHEAQRDRIIAAAGAMGLIPTFPGWSAALHRRLEGNPGRYGFDKPVDRRTIEKALAYLLQKNGTTVPSCAPQPTGATYPMAFTTTSTT